MDLTTVLAFTPEPIPGLQERVDTLGGWVMWASYTVCAIAFIIGAGYIAFDKITDGHHNKGVRIAAGAIIGSMLIAASTAIVSAAQG